MPKVTCEGLTAVLPDGRIAQVCPRPWCPMGLDRAAKVRRPSTNNPAKEGRDAAIDLGKACRQRQQAPNN